MLLTYDDVIDAAVLDDVMTVLSDSNWWVLMDASPSPSPPHADFIVLLSRVSQGEWAERGADLQEPAVWLVRSATAHPGNQGNDTHAQHTHFTKLHMGFISEVLSLTEQSKQKLGLHWVNTRSLPVSLFPLLVVVFLSFFCFLLCPSPFVWLQGDAALLLSRVLGGRVGEGVGFLKYLRVSVVF